MIMWSKAKIFLFFLFTLVAAGCLFDALGASRANAAASESESLGPVVFEVTEDTPVVQAGKRQKVIVRALVRPDGAKRKRFPLAVALVLDKSGSMSSDGKMDNAKLGAMKALERLNAGDLATVIVYDEEASVKVSARSVSDERVFSKAISRIRPGGSTALYDGVRLGADQLRPFVKDGYVPRVILLSDGIANVGPSSTRELAALGRALAE